MKKKIVATPRHKNLIDSNGKNHFAHTLAPSLRTLLFLLAAGIFLFSCEDDVKPSSEPSLITSLTLTVERKDYKITFKDRQGTITLPYSTKLPVEAKVKAAVLSEKTTGIKVGDDVTIPASGPLTVTAENGETTQEYTVTVKKADPNSEASITDLTLGIEHRDYEIDFTDRAYTLTLPADYTLPTTVEVYKIVLSPGATSDAGTNLSVTDNAVTITVTAEDGKTTQKYTVRLTISVGIISFTFEVTDNESMALDADDRKQIVGMINQQAKTITFDQQSAYVYRDKLKATFKVSEEGAAVQVGGEPQESGTTEQDFTSPVSYIVRAQDGTETTYTVTLTGSTLATIPDDPFRKRLKRLIPAAFTEEQLDITHKDVSNYSTIDVNNTFNQTPTITSLKGIEFFTALDTLNCSNNALTALDIRGNTALKTLNCSVNNLASLDVSKHTALKDLKCFNNSLRSLDVRVNTALTSLLCQDNSLSSLDVNANTALMFLNCGGNALTSLNLSANTALESLSCSGNSLTSLDVSGNTVLTVFNCGGNNLTSLDMTGMSNIDLLRLGTGTGTDLEPDNHLLATLRVNTAVQDDANIVTIKTARGVNLTITTVDNDGNVVCNDYTPDDPKGNCNDTP